MKRLPSSPTMIAAAMLLVVAHVLSVPVSFAARSGEAPPMVPAAIEVPSGSTLLFSSHAEGVQTYECRDGQWTFRSPRARLFDANTGRTNALHYGGVDRNRTPGPWWDALRDASRIRAGEAVSTPSPNPNSIPLLRLKVLEREGTGMFSPVTFIQRLNTVGGVGPAGSCTTSQRVNVPYSADYYFYGTP